MDKLIVELIDDEANLTGADLVFSHLDGANLQNSNLAGANLRGTILWHANFEHANLRGAHLAGAMVDPDFMEKYEVVVDRYSISRLQLKQ